MSARQIKIKRKRSPSEVDIKSPLKAPRITSLGTAHDRAVHEFIDVLEEIECCQPQDAGGPIVLKASTLLMSIKSYQRRLLDRLQHTAAEAEARRLELHKQTLELEALNYESSNLQGQLKAYTEFPTPQLEKMAREEVKDMDSDAMDVINLFLCGSVLKSHEDPKQHESIMQKLHKEINSRGNLERDVKLAQKKLGEQKRVFDDKQAFMAEFPKMLEKLEQASLPLQQFFQVPKDSPSLDLLSSDRRKRLDLAKLLPGPLYTLFIQLQSHLDSWGENGATVQVVSQSKGARKGHPIFVKNFIQLTFHVPDIVIKEGSPVKQTTVCIDFAYYPTLKIVTAKATGSADKIDAESVLMNLFPGDDGEFTLIKVGEGASKLSSRPYSWCNYMAGLHLATPWGDSSSMTMCTKLIMAELLNRVRANATLTQLLFSFAKRKVIPVHPLMVEDIVVHSSCVTKMQSFAEHTPEQPKPNESYYQAILKRKGATVRAIVSLDLSRYPSIPPTWSLTTGEERWGEMHGSATSLEACTNPLYSNALGSIASSVNVNVIALVKPEIIETHYWLVSHQLQTIITMWDQSQKAAEDGSFNGDRSLKGRDRM